MRFISTRGQAPAVGFVETLLASLAPDGGLYCPMDWPQIPPDQIAGFAGKAYSGVAAEILGLFVGDEISPQGLRSICDQAYSGFAHPATTPLRQIGPGLHILELFHGPSLAFKDVAMQLLAGLYEHVLAARGETLTIVCATSGDTGGAAVEAFAGRSNIRLVVLFPDGRISEVQRRFITTSGAPNVRAVAVDGDFDDCQAILKALLRDREFSAEVELGAVNSINFVRIAAQCVYFFVAAAALGAPARPVAFAVPTGNFGDAFAGWAAQAMGLRVERLLAATNSNAIVANALETGVYKRAPLIATQSPAMDIQVASNFERLYFEASGRDGAVTRRAFDGFEQGGALAIPPKLLANMRLILKGASADEAQTSAAIAAAWREDCGLVDPHTAVALAATKGVDFAATTPLVVLGTAHPAKFPEAIEAAVGFSAPVPDAVRWVAGRRERFDHLVADVRAVRNYVQEFVSS